MSSCNSVLIPLADSIPTESLEKLFPSRHESFPFFSTFPLFFSSSSQQLLNKSCSSLSSIKIKELEANNNWTIIDLSHNSIDSVDFPDLLEKQIYLETLRLNSNSNFKGRNDERIFEHKTLKNFECRECGFAEIASQHFAGFVSLENLYLSANKINRINEGAFKLNEKLQLVDLTENRITKVPPSTFANLKSFAVLYLTMNNIELPKKQPFLKSDSLKHLRLNDCNIPAIDPETFSELCNLESLNLNRNKIKSLTVTSFKSNAKLESLLIESNQIKDFTSVTPDFMKQLKELCIDNNTLNFDLESTKRFLKNYEEGELRSDKCNNNIELFIENSFNQNSTDKSAKFVEKFINEGISDFFIGSYISIFLILQAIAFVVLSIYLIKITKYEKLDGDNYANTILNDNEIYRLLYKRDE